MIVDGVQFKLPTFNYKPYKNGNQKIKKIQGWGRRQQQNDKDHQRKG
jgi:hypothetical protein